MSTITNEEIAALLDAHNGGSRDPWQHGQKMANALEKLAAEREWQPIETAPKDRRFLARTQIVIDEYDEDDRLTHKGRIERQTVVAYYALGMFVEYPYSGSIPINREFTHWCELPAPPSEKEEDSHE